MFVVRYCFSLAEPGQLGQPCGRPGAMRHGRAGHGSPCRSPGVRRCCTDGAGHEGSSLAHPLRCGRWARVSDHGALRLRGLAYRRASSRGWHGRMLWPTSAVLEAGIVAPAGLWCLGSPVLRLRRRVLPVAMSAPPSKGGFTRQGWAVHSDKCLQVRGVLARRYCARTGVCCRRPCLVHPARWACMVYQQGDQCSGMPGGSWRRGLGLLPGLSWDGGMLLYARHSGLMLGSVPGHVLSHVCGHVRSMCPVWVCQYSNTLLGIQYTCRGCPKHLGLA